MMNVRESAAYLRSIGLELRYSGKRHLPWALVVPNRGAWMCFTSLNHLWNFLGSIAIRHFKSAQAVEAIASIAIEDARKYRRLQVWAQSRGAQLPQFAIDAHHNSQSQPFDLPANWPKPYAELVRTFGSVNEPMFARMLMKKLLAIQSETAASLIHKSVERVRGRSWSERMDQQSVGAAWREII